MPYGSGVYGTEKYGDAGAALTSPYKWILIVDWGGVSTDESGRLLGIRVERGITKYTNGSGDGLQDIQAGRLSLVLSNHDRRYDPRNTSSAIYPNCTNLTAIKLLVNDTSDGTQYPVFAGTIEDIRPGGGTEKTVTITAYDDIETLRQQTATTPLIFNTTASAAIQAIAETVGIAGGVYHASAHPLTVFALENTNALQAACDITEASLGQLFCDRLGRLTYYPLSYTGMASHALDEDNVDKDIEQTQPWDERYPSVQVYANRWARTATKVLWDYGGTFAVPSGSSRTVRAEWSQIGAVGALNYSKNTYVSAPGVLTNALSAYLSNITARSCDITVTNVSPWDQATRLQLMGKEFVTGITFSDRRYQPGAKVKGGSSATVSTKQLYSAEDTTLPQKRRAKFVLDSEYLHDGAFASAYATLLKDHLKSGLSTVTVTFATPATMAQAFGMELFDLVEFTSATLGIDDDYYLGSIRHEWSDPNPGDVRTTMVLVKLLKSSTSITPEPVVEIPEELTPEPPDPGTLPPETGGGIECLADAPANGPYNLLGSGPNVLYNYGSLNVGTYSFPCQIRNNVHTYRTLVDIAYITEATTDGGATWHATAPSAINVRAINSSGATVATATSISTSQWRFEIPSNVIAAAIIVEIPTGSILALPGSVLASGSVDGNNESGIVAATGLAVGQYYSIEATTASTWKTRVPDPVGYNSYRFQADWGGGYTGGTVETPVSFTGSVQTDVLAVYNFDARSDYEGIVVRTFWEASQDSVSIRVADNGGTFFDNSGSLGFIVKSALVIGSTRVTITKLTISNICPAS